MSHMISYIKDCVCQFWSFIIFSMQIAKCCSEWVLCNIKWRSLDYLLMWTRFLNVGKRYTFMWQHRNWMEFSSAYMQLILWINLPIIGVQSDWCIHHKFINTSAIWHNDRRYWMTCRIFFTTYTTDFAVFVKIEIVAYIINIIVWQMNML